MAKKTKVVTKKSEEEMVDPQPVSKHGVAIFPEGEHPKLRQLEAKKLKEEGEENEEPTSVGPEPESVSPHQEYGPEGDGSKES